MTQLEGTDVFVRKIKYSWVSPLLQGEVKDKDMQKFMIELLFKIICDKDGNAIKEDDLDLDDFTAAQKYLMNKITPQKKS